ncbi:MAG: AsmA-like C-terminal region-containing protein [Candidatus Omnitrophota bacterium]
MTNFSTKLYLKFVVIFLITIFMIIHTASLIFTQINKGILKENILSEIKKLSAAKVSFDDLSVHLLLGLKITNLTLEYENNNFIFIKELCLKHRLLPLLKKRAVYSKILCFDPVIFLVCPEKSAAQIISLENLELPLKGKSPFLFDWEINSPNIRVRNCKLHYTDFCREESLRFAFQKLNLSANIPNQIYPLKLNLSTQLLNNQKTTIKINTVISNLKNPHLYISAKANFFPIDYIRRYIKEFPLNSGSVNLQTRIKINKNGKMSSAGKILFLNTVYHSRHFIRKNFRLENLPIAFTLNGHYDKNTWYFTNSTVNIAQMFVDISGSIFAPPQSPSEVNLILYTKNQKLKRLKFFINNIDLTGTFESNLHIAGLINKPLTSGKITLNNLALENKNQGIVINDLNGEINIENNKILLTNLTTYLNNNYIEAKGRVDDFKKTLLTIDAKIFPPLTLKEPIVAMSIRSHIKAEFTDKLYGSISFIIKLQTSDNENQNMILDFQDLYYPSLSTGQDKNIFGFKKFTIYSYTQHSKQKAYHLDFKNLNLETYIKDKTLWIDNINAIGYRGKLAGSFSIKTAFDDSKILGCLHIKDIEITEFLKIFHPDPPIEGLFTTTIWFNLTNLSCEGNAHLKNGVLPAKGPLRLTSKYLGVPLENISLKTLSLDFDIKDMVLYINNLNINSNEVSARANFKIDIKENVSGTTNVKFNPRLLKKSVKMQAIAMLLGERLSDLQFLFKFAGSLKNPRVELVRQNLKQRMSFLIDINRRRIEKNVESALDKLFYE